MSGLSELPSSRERYVRTEKILVGGNEIFLSSNDFAFYSELPRLKEESITELEWSTRVLGAELDPAKRRVRAQAVAIRINELVRPFGAVVAYDHSKGARENYRYWYEKEVTPDPIEQVRKAMQSPEFRFTRRIISSLKYDKLWWKEVVAANNDVILETIVDEKGGIQKFRYQDLDEDSFRPLLEKGLDGLFKLRKSQELADALSICDPDLERELSCLVMYNKRVKLTAKGIQDLATRKLKNARAAFS